MLYGFRGSEWGLVFRVICPQCLVFAVKLANILMFTAFGENTVKCLEGFS